MKTCAVCGAAAPLDAPHCSACGEASWLATRAAGEPLGPIPEIPDQAALFASATAAAGPVREAPPSVSLLPADEPAEDGDEPEDGEDEPAGEQPATTPGAPPVPRRERRRRRAKPN